MFRVLILGGAGQIGAELAAHEWGSKCELHLPSRVEFDLCDAQAIMRKVAEGGYSAVVNCGAYTAVDKAETDITNAWYANALGPAALAEATKALRIPLVHVSTDYVFDGRKQGPYDPGDPVAPINVYGASKEAGEQAVRTGNPNHIILRTAWVFSKQRSNFVKTMLNLARGRAQIKVVDDQTGNPTSAQDIADVIVRIATRLLDDETSPRGTYHFVNKGDATWYTFAKHIFAKRAVGSEPLIEIIPIKTSDYPTPARRPQNSRLSSGAIERDFGIFARPWQDAVGEVLDALEGKS